MSHIRISGTMGHSVISGFWGQFALDFPVTLEDIDAI